MLPSAPAQVDLVPFLCHPIPPAHPPGTAAPRDAPAALQPYAEWCAAADVRAPALELRASPAAAGGRGAFAIRLDSSLPGPTSRAGSFPPCGSHGSRVPCVPGMGSICVAGLRSRPVGAGEVLVDLPLSAVLHVVQGMATPFPDFVSEAGVLVSIGRALGCGRIHSPPADCPGYPKGGLQSKPVIFSNS